MDIDYAYDLDRLIDRGITDNQSMINAILAEALPYLPIHMKAPKLWLQRVLHPRARTATP